MWFLPTRGRPRETQAMIEAMYAVGDVPNVAVMIDDDPKVYADVAWPSHWELHVAQGHIEMTKALNTLFNMFPREQSYGFFGDHFRPITHWSKPLEEAAGDWFIAWPNDEKISHRQPAGAPCFGGKLARALGWICLPTTHHLCTDRPWWFLWRELGLGKHVESVRYTRDWDRQERDRNYNGVNLKSHDYLAWIRWRDLEAPRVVHDLREAIYRAGVPIDGHLVRGGSPFVEGW